MLIEIEGLTKSYRRGLRRVPSVRANDGISLRVDAGEVMGLLGHNGAGKTTLVNQVVGLLRPDAGTITIDGRDAVRDPGFARRVCSLQPQAHVPIAGLTPRQGIDMLGRLRGGNAEAIRARRDWLAEALDIGEWLDTDGSRLSGGVKRLVSFAMAAVVPGRVVIFDEPTNDVDPVRRRHLWGLVRALADEGAAVLLVTHNVLEAERAVDRLVIMDHGRVIATGSPAQLRDGVGSDLRLELLTGSGAVAPAPPPGVRRYVTNGSRALATIPADGAAEAIAWASVLREAGVIEEFSLTPASLEDVYVELVGRATVAAGHRGEDGASAVPEEEVIDVRAA